MIQELDALQIHFDANALKLVNFTLSIIMFGVALDITIADFKKLSKHPKPMFIGIFSQFFLVPLATIVLIHIFKPQASIALGMIMIAACPGGTVSNFMTKIAKGNTALSVSLTAFATVAALIMTPINLSIWSNFYEPSAQLLKKIDMDPWEVAKLIVLVLGIPLILGMYVRNVKPNIAKKMSKLLRPISILIFLTLISVAFYNNLDIFKTHIKYVFFLVIIHNVVLYLVGYFSAKLGKQSFKNRKTLTIETGIQNAGLGLMLTFLFFDDLGGMALLVAFWGIWDILSGLLLSFYWSNKKGV